MVLSRLRVRGQCVCLFWWPNLASFCMTTRMQTNMHDMTAQECITAAGDPKSRVARLDCSGNASEVQLGMPIFGSFCPPDLIPHATKLRFCQHSCTATLVSGFALAKGQSTFLESQCGGISQIWKNDNIVSNKVGREAEYLYYLRLHIRVFHTQPRLHWPCTQ